MFLVYEMILQFYLVYFYIPHSPLKCQHSKAKYFFFFLRVERVRRFLNAKFNIEILRDCTWLKTGSSFWQFNAFSIMMALHASEFLKKELTLGLKVVSFSLNTSWSSLLLTSNPREDLFEEERQLLPLGRSAFVLCIR